MRHTIACQPMPPPPAFSIGIAIIDAAATAEVIEGCHVTFCVSRHNSPYPFFLPFLQKNRRKSVVFYRKLLILQSLAKCQIQDTVIFGFGKKSFRSDNIY